jgi:hypothetical protein
MSVRTAEEWARLTTEALSRLIVSDDRRDFILERYPPSDTGRPGVLHTTPRGEKRHVREMDVDPPVEADTPEWRKTFEFLGEQDTLELTEVAAD